MKIKKSPDTPIPIFVIKNAKEWKKPKHVEGGGLTWANIAGDTRGE